MSNVTLRTKVFPGGVAPTPLKVARSASKSPAEEQVQRRVSRLIVPRAEVNRPEIGVEGHEQRRVFVRRSITDVAAVLIGIADLQRHADVSGELEKTLAAVADRHGLSFYSDHTLCSRLQLSQPTLEQARQELLERDLIAHQLPLVQVLSLPTPATSRRPEPGQGLIRLGELFSQVGIAATAEPRRTAP